LLKQPQFSPLRVEEQVAVIYAGTRGYLDKLPVGDVTRFEAEFLSHLNGNHKEMLNAIRDKQKLDDELEGKLKDVLETFTKSFA
nr:F0F1 ATP synthase subunit alpha [Hyphomicrobiales bacterium]